MTAKILLKGSLFRTLLFFTNIITGFIMMPFILHSLGDRIYGLWAIIGSLLGFYGLFDIGLSSATQRYISRALGERNSREINTIASTSFFIFTIIGLIVFVFTCLAIFFAPLFLKNIYDLSLFRKVILVLGVNLAIDLPMRVLSGVLIARFRYDITAAIQFSMIILRTILIVVFLSNGYGILALAAITFFAGRINNVLTLFFTKSIEKNLQISRRFINTRHMHPLFSYSIITLIAGVGDRLRFNIDNFVIAAFLGLNLVTVYSVAARIVGYFVDFLTSASGLMKPVFSQYEGIGDYEAIRDKLIFVTRLNGYLTILAGGSLIIFGKAFIIRWLGKSYAGAYPSLVILVSALIFDLMQMPSTELLYGISKHKFYAISNSIEGIANLILSLLLVKKYGIVGVALGTAIPLIIIKFFVQPVYVCGLINLSLRKYYFEIMAPIILQSLAILLVGQWLLKSLIVPNYFFLLIATCFQFALFILVVMAFGITAMERNLLRRAIFSNQ